MSRIEREEPKNVDEIVKALNTRGQRLAWSDGRVFSNITKEKVRFETTDLETVARKINEVYALTEDQTEQIQEAVERRIKSLKGRVFARLFYGKKIEEAIEKLKTFSLAIKPARQPAPDKSQGMLPKSEASARRSSADADKTKKTAASATPASTGKAESSSRRDYKIKVVPKSLTLLENQLVQIYGEDAVKPIRQTEEWKMLKEHNAFPTKELVTFLEEYCQDEVRLLDEKKKSLPSELKTKKTDPEYAPVPMKVFLQNLREKFPKDQTRINEIIKSFEPPQGFNKSWGQCKTFQEKNWYAWKEFSKEGALIGSDWRKHFENAIKIELTNQRRWTQQ